MGGGGLRSEHDGLFKDESAPERLLIACLCTTLTCLAVRQKWKKRFRQTSVQSESHRSRLSNRVKKIKGKIHSERGRRRQWREMTFFKILFERFWLCELFIAGNCDVSFVLCIFSSFWLLSLSAKRSFLSSTSDCHCVKSNFSNHLL